MKMDSAAIERFGILGKQRGEVRCCGEILVNGRPLLLQVAGKVTACCTPHAGLTKVSACLGVEKKGCGMLANYGYQDGSGKFFITIDTDKCNGCGDCAKACPAGVFSILDEDPNDPLRDEPVAAIGKEEKVRLKYKCDSCKPTSDRLPLPCVEACCEKAISHSW